jgi:hypothetical protein
MLTLHNMVLEIPVWYLHPPAMVPQPSLPPQTEGIPMQIPILTPTTPPAPPLTSTITTVGGRWKNKYPTAPLPPRVQPPCALCEKDGHPTNKRSSLPELCNLIQLPRATTSPVVSSNSPNSTITSPRGGKGLRTKFSCVICLEYGHYTHHCPVLPHFWQTLVVVCQIFQQEPLPSASSHTHVTDIHYVTTSLNEHMQCPCSLCESIYHFTYQCPTSIEYRHCQLALLPNPTITPPPVTPIVPPNPSPDMVYIFSPEPEALPTPPSFIDSLKEDFLPNPPNSPIHFPTEILRPTTIFNPQYLDIWFMSNKPSQPCFVISPTSSPEGKNMVTVTNVIPLDPLYYRQFHCDEDILEELTTLDFPWDLLHHRALFLSQESFTLPRQNPIYAIETKDFLPSGHIDWFNNPISARNAFEEGNMANISPTVKIDISIKPGIIEEIIISAACSPEELIAYKSLFQEYRDIFSWSYTEMPDLDPSIVEHHIDTWPDITHVRKKKCPLHLSNAATIKADIDKLRVAGFIYPIAYTSWVSNLVPVNKKHGIICVYMDFRDLNHACPKANYPIPFIDQIIDDCADHEALAFIDGFSGYNQFQIHPADQYKTTFSTPWGNFSYCVMPFGLKNTGATFQCAMTYIFHDLVQIILAYLDNLTAQSKKRTQHLDDLRIVFQRCRRYHIHLNPLKCVFCVTTGHLLGFIVSQHGIIVDPLKVQDITENPPPRNLRQLQILQGKANFLRHFVPDYTTRAHGFLHLLRHDIPFQWDEHAQTDFDDLKADLSNAPLSNPPNYDSNYILYLSASTVSIAGVLFQLGDDDWENVIYFVSKNLSGPPLKYNH